MINYQQKRYWKVILFLFAILISLSSLLYTKILVDKLQIEQYKMVKLLADTYKKMGNPNELGNQDIFFLFSITLTNEDIPLIMVDTNDVMIDYKNLDSAKMESPDYFKKQLNLMKKKYDPIEIQYTEKNKHLIYYKDSLLITQLRIYPFIQLFLVILFILLAYFAFNSSRKYEQNKVWTGMSRETAHQLGTPVSSLMALSETIKALDGQLNDEILNEFDKDIHRLEIITDRFSKIGTIPKLIEKNIFEQIEQNIDYLRPRISKQVNLDIKVHNDDKEIKAHIIPPLFDWVIENLVKNAINAMEGQGNIIIEIMEQTDAVVIDITDDGKGIPRNKFKTIFKAGYTTNKRGWGLGLSLSKRIIEMYHNSHIFVKTSEIGTGSTFRIKLKKVS